MKTRIITGFLLFGITIYLLWFTSNVFFLIASSVLFLPVAWEWASLAGLRSLLAQLSFLLIFIFLLVLLYFQLIPNLLWLWINAFVMGWAIYKLYRFNKGKTVLKERSKYHKCLNIFLGWILISSMWLAINLMRLSPFSPNWLFLLVAIIASTDIGGYFVGRYCGRYKLLPKVSPKKTVEGLLGGLALAFIIGSGIIYLFPMPFYINRLHLLPLIGLISILSVLGDLFESMLKREINLKDSGKILPGHGGVLDRLDGYLFALPVYALISIYLL